MKKTLHIIACLGIVFFAWACERPKSPDFKLNHELQVPLTVQKTYPFLGNSDAIVDTTSDNFDNLFTTNGKGLVRLTKEQDFNFGDLNDAIPEVNAAPATVSAQVGEIGLTNFNSGSGNVGSAGFQNITGFPSPSQGQPIPGGATPGTVNIDFSTDYFQSAVIKKDGKLQLVVTNNLGFDIDHLKIGLNSGSATVGSTTIAPFSFDPNGNNTDTTEIDIPANISATTPLEDINVDISADWSPQTMEAQGNNLIVNRVTGQNLVASQVTAVLESQQFKSTGTSHIDQSNFEFRDPSDFVELKSGELTLNIDNQIDLGVTTLDITFQDIKDENGNDLVLNLSNIPSRSAGGSFNKTVDLAGYQIKAQNGNIDYTIDAKTENTQQGSGSSARTIRESDELMAEVDLNNLSISRAKGYIVPRKVLLNDDLTNDGRTNVDVFNDNEAELTSLDGISDLSDHVSNITFENPVLNTMYKTNIGVNTTIYAVIAGRDADGNTVYLTGTSGSKYAVTSSEIPNELEVNGQAATKDQVIKFSIQEAQNPDPQQGESGSNVFDASNTNASDFFSNLPTEIRFVGIANVNQEQTTGEIVNPVIFDPSLNVELPFNFSADGATFKDTLDADLGDLPGQNDKNEELSQATLTLNYTNGLPLDLDLSLKFLDKNGNEVTTKNNIAIDPASTNSDGYVEDGGAAENKAEISFSDDELQILNQTRTIVVDIVINTSQKQAVKVRSDDSITLQVQMKAGITSTVN